MENKITVMRVALRDVSRIAEEMTRGTMTGESVDRKTVDAWAKRLCEIISRDLAIPLRNCDIGTAEEQSNRMRQFCAKRKINGIVNCGYCPIKHQYQRDCTLAWAQMPYAEEGGTK
jgi:aldehyde:ferredoxin oxidoreductase